MIIQVISNSMIFPFMELFIVIFQVFHDSRACGNPVLNNGETGLTDGEKLMRLELHETYRPK